MKTLTALIPVFNEERTVTELVIQLDALPKGILSECIFVDDGSTDSSAQLLSQALQGVHFKSQIISKDNGGKASAIQKGSKALTTSHVVILDSDLELATADIEKLWSVVTSGESDYVFGYRAFLAHSSFTYRYSRGNQLISNIYGIFFNEVITDIMCGYKLVPSQTLQNLPYKYKRFGLEIEIPMHMWLHHQRPYEVDVAYKARSRAQGKSISVKMPSPLLLQWPRLESLIAGPRCETVAQPIARRILSSKLIYSIYLVGYFLSWLFLWRLFRCRQYRQNR